MRAEEKCKHEAIMFVPELWNKWRCVSCGKLATAQYFKTSTQVSRNTHPTTVVREE